MATIAANLLALADIKTDIAANLVTMGVTAADTESLASLAAKILSVDRNLALLLHFDGADGSTTFTDVMGNTVTPSGNAQIDTDLSKFGGASAIFDGTGDYLTIPNNHEFDFSNSNFTIDFWIHLSNKASGQVFNKGGVPGSLFPQYQLEVKSAGDLRFQAFTSGGGTIADVSFAIPINEWVHIAIVRNSTTFTVYENGVSQGTYTSSTAIGYDPTKPFLIGYQTSGATSAYFQGSLDEFRISNGVARWTANFTPPNAAY